MEVVLFVALVWKVIDFLRLLVNLHAQRSAVLTQLSAWAGAIAIVGLGAHAAVVRGVVMPGTSVPLGKLDFGSIILVGFMIGSGASASVDLKQAIDGHDSAVKPPLLDAPTPPPQI